MSRNAKHWTALHLLAGRIYDLHPENDWQLHDGIHLLDDCLIPELTEKRFTEYKNDESVP